MLAETGIFTVSKGHPLNAYSPTFFKDFKTSKFFKDTQFLKAFFLIFFTYDMSVTLVSEQQSLKAFSLIVVTLFEKETLFKFEHPLNIDHPIIVIESDIETWVIEEQPSKDECPIDFIFSLKTTDSDLKTTESDLKTDSNELLIDTKDLQSRKDFHPIELTVSGMTTFCKLSQFSKALLPIDLNVEGIEMHIKDEQP